jgi:Zn-dependent M28 family amino/carboxypeptidase
MNPLAAVLGLCLTMGTQISCGGSKSVETVQKKAEEKPSLVGQPAPPPSETDGFDGQKAYEHVAKLVAIGPRTPDSDGIHRAQEYIKEQLKADGCPFEEDDFHASTPIGVVAMKNILVKAPGDGDHPVLLLTHYDTLRKEGFVGAVDGGSSTGLMLEMARVVCGRKNAEPVWIAFLDGEEAFIQWSDTDSTFGSREMAAKMSASGELKKVKAVILADMVGPKNLKIRRDENSTPWLVDLVWSVAARLGYQDEFLSSTTAILDDHESFTRRKAPAVDIVCDLKDYPYWHTTEDTLDKVSARNMAIVGHVILETIAELDKRK